jgi:hypothetical protein
MAIFVIPCGWLLFILDFIKKVYDLKYGWMAQNQLFAGDMDPSN